MPAPDPTIIQTAVARAVTGDHQGGLSLLQPIVDAGPRSRYALLGALAETASHPTRQNNDPGQQYGLEVVGPDGPADAELLPPPYRFAARFVTAWASRDQDTAYALYQAVAEHSNREGTADLADAITAVFALAVASAEHILNEQRRHEAGDIT